MNPKQYKYTILLLLLCFVMLGTKGCVDQVRMTENHQSKQDQLQHQIDSLKSELFTTQMITTRYEITLDWLKTENPKAATQFEDYLSNNTE